MNNSYHNEIENLIVFDRSTSSVYTCPNCGYRNTGSVKDKAIHSSHPDNILCVDCGFIYNKYKSVYRGY